MAVAVVSMAYFLHFCFVIDYNRRCHENLYFHVVSFCYFICSSYVHPLMYLQWRTLWNRLMFWAKKGVQVSPLRLKPLPEFLTEARNVSRFITRRTELPPGGDVRTGANVHNALRGRSLQDHFYLGGATNTLWHGTWCPRYKTWLWKKWHLEIFNFKLASQKHRMACRCSRCSDFDVLNMMMLLRWPIQNGGSAKTSCKSLWKVAGALQSLNRRTPNSYSP